MMKKSNAVKHPLTFVGVALALVIVSWAVILEPEAVGQSKSAKVSIIKGASNPGITNPYVPVGEIGK
jgi:hypothetical protein